MAKITWLGEDGLGIAGPSFTIAFGGVKFPKDTPVEMMDKDTIARARRNRFFEVSGVPGRPPAAVKTEVKADEQNEG
jgi:hypothetical protein